jgi:hypothetical protein
VGHRVRKGLCIAERGLLLGMKLTRAALNEGIRRLQRDLECRTPHRALRKIDIR